MSARTRRRASDPVKTVDPIWAEVRAEADEIVRTVPTMASFVFATVLNHDRLEDAIVDRISLREKLV